MSSIANQIKHPDDVLDFKFDYDALGWLEDGETISSSSWVIPAGITEDSETQDATTATIWISGGTAGVDYLCTNTIVTSDSRTRVTSFYLLVRDCP